MKTFAIIGGLLLVVIAAGVAFSVFADVRNQ
jgi:hypothetical protein